MPRCALKAVVILHGKGKAEGCGDADSRCAADPHLADRREHRFAGILHFMHDFVGQASLVEQGENGSVPGRCKRNAGR